MNAATEDSRLLYQTPVLTQPVRISGTPRVTLNAAFSKTKANITAILVSLPESGARHDPDARLEGPGEPQQRLHHVADHAGDASTACRSTCRPRTPSSRPAAGWA